MRKSLGAMAVAALMLTTGLALNTAHAGPPKEGGKKPAAKAEKYITTKSGLKYMDIKVGKGASPKSGQTVTVNYVGTLTNGQKFDASADHGGTFSFPIGQHQVIAGWDEGVMSMKVGGKRKLICPPNLAYGERSPGPGIPSNATLVFEVELLKVGP